MEEIFLNLLKQTPGLAVAVGIVFIFVRHLGIKDSQSNEVQRESHAVMREVSRSIGEVTVALSNMNGKKR